MGGIRVLVMIDNDGHYQGAPLNDRRKVVEVLKEISDGDYYPMVIKDYDLEDKDPWSFGIKEWDNFVYSFVQRRICEIIKI